jgi:carboxymethylenebutenolidase
VPVYQPDHVEYAINTGHIQVAYEDGQLLPAYWAHPSSGGVFPGIVLVHDWWGLTDIERHLANLFAQSGYYVIAPDLFGGQTAVTPQQALALVEQLGNGYPPVDAALRALETHHRCNRCVAAVGFGLGGTLALQAALTRDDLEAAVAFYGFPQRFLGTFAQTKAPILAVYGSDEPHVPAEVRQQFETELVASSENAFLTMGGVTRDFFAADADPEVARQAWTAILAFLDQYLEAPSRPPKAAL